jgi:hypothetical protein
MGNEDMSTVYAAELRAIEAALTLVLESTGPGRTGEKRARHLRKQPSGIEDAVGTSLPGRMPRPDKATRSQRRPDLAQVDTCSSGTGQ